ncbi:general odorant-binding protein 69a-like [Prorops nasuta]|uniref:general odorant-binding protein 69a-like n=1 Tax=Prorops nasuta TaxID=863751 RepID=UPI0034CE00B2
MTKLFLVLSLAGLIAVAQCGETPELLKMVTANLRRTCIQRTGVAEDVIDNTSKGIFANDNKLKCYFKCVFEELTMLDESGQINFNFLLDMLPASARKAAEKVVEDCKGITGKDLCDMSYNVNKCAYLSNPQIYFTI